MHALLLVATLLAQPLAPSSPASTCTDAAADCRYWAHSQNECTTNSAWMDLRCPNACGACLGECGDSDPSCKEWAEEGECDKNSRFMIERCPGSCDLCPRLDGGALQCDSCLALQEAIWRSLQPLPPSENIHVQHRHRSGVRELSVADVRRAVADACVSHEWVSLGVGLPYHTVCETVISSKFSTIESAWLEAMRHIPWHEMDPPSDPLLAPPKPRAWPPTKLDRPSRATALRLKRQLCLTPSLEIGLSRGPDGLGMCNEQRGRTLLGLGAPPIGSSACEACRAFVEDAVSLMRRGGRLLNPSDPETADRRNAVTQLQGLCADVELRRNVTDGAVDMLTSRCDALLREHFDQLTSLTFQWARPDVVELMCYTTLGVCEEDRRREEL